MFVLTRQEQGVLIFVAVSILCGSVFLLFQKRYPAVMKVLDRPLEQIIRSKISVNSADRTQWESLPGIGPYRAQRIMEERRARGGFQSVEDVRYIKGIGPYVFNQIRPYLRLD